MKKPPRLLVIAGSDSGGGAGIQADIKTACAFGVYAMTAVTAVTAQDTTGVHAIQFMPPSLVREQIACCLSDIGADAIKIGMLGSGEIAEAVAEILEREARGIPLVLDPVLVSTSGTMLLDERGIAVLKSRLVPLAALVTPNLGEFEIVAPDGNPKSILGLGAGAVLVKGGHAEGENAIDTLYTRGTSESFGRPRLRSRSTHGTGCTLATAIACGLASGRTLAVSIEMARDYIQTAIATAPGFGRGHGPLNHLPPK